MQALVHSTSCYEASSIALQRCQNRASSSSRCQYVTSSTSRLQGYHKVAALRSLGREARYDHGEKFDIVLSSGFLAFANHSGFLQAIEDVGVKVAGVMGTSAGALAGSLYCAGYSPRQVARELSRDPPFMLLRPSGSPWRGGILSLDGVVDRLRELLPPTFEELEKEFAVGVVTADGQHVLVDKGPLPEAVAASAAIPFLFQPVDIPGHHVSSPFKDGGVVDRIGLKAWRDRRRNQIVASGIKVERPPPCLVHVISRSSPFSGFDDAASTGESHITVVRSPKSGVNLLSLGDFEDDMRSAIKRTRPQVEVLLRDSRSPERKRAVTPV